MGARWGARTHASVPYVLARRLIDPETGFSSWSKISVPAAPTQPPYPRLAQHFTRTLADRPTECSVLRCVWPAGCVVHSVGWSGGGKQKSLSQMLANVAMRQVEYMSRFRTRPVQVPSVPLLPGEVIRSMRIIAVPFTKDEARQNSVLPIDISAGYMSDSSTNTPSLSQLHIACVQLANALAEEKAPPDVPQVGTTAWALANIPQRRAHTPGWVQ